MVGWHHRLNGHGFGWILGVGDGQRGLVCCGSWGRKESDTTELNEAYKSLQSIEQIYGFHQASYGFIPSYNSCKFPLGKTMVFSTITGVND